MKPRTTLTIIVGVISFVVAFALSFLANAAGHRSGDMTLTFAIAGTSIAALIGVIWWNLRNNRKVPMADEAQRRAALSTAPAPGTGRLIVYREGFVGKMAGVDILVDGARVAQLKSPRFTAIDLPPGPHAVTGAAQGKITVPVEVMLPAGGAAAVKVSMVIGGLTAAQEDVAAVHPRLASMPMVLPDGAAAVFQ